MNYLLKSEDSCKCQENDESRTILLATLDELEVMDYQATPEVDLVTRVLALCKNLNLSNKLNIHRNNAYSLEKAFV